MSKNKGGNFCEKSPNPIFSACGGQNHPKYLILHCFSCLFSSYTILARRSRKFLAFCTRNTWFSLRQSIENTSKIPKNFRLAAGSDVEKQGGIFAWNSSDESHSCFWSCGYHPSHGRRSRNSGTLHASPKIIFFVNGKVISQYGLMVCNNNEGKEVIKIILVTDKNTWV